MIRYMSTNRDIVAREKDIVVGSHRSIPPIKSSPVDLPLIVATKKPTMARKSKRTPAMVVKAKDIVL